MTQKFRILPSFLTYVVIAEKGLFLMESEL